MKSCTYTSVIIISMFTTLIAFFILQWWVGSDLSVSSVTFQGKVIERECYQNNGGFYCDAFITSNISVEGHVTVNEKVEVNDTVINRCQVIETTLYCQETWSKDVK